MKKKNRKKSVLPFEEDFRIPIQVTNEEDLYEAFDPQHMQLSGAVRDYIGEYILDRKFGEHVVLELHTDKAIDKEKFTAVCRKYIEQLLNRCVRDRARMFANSIRLFIIGVIVVSGGIALSQVLDAVWAEIISIIGSLSVWDAATIWLEDMPENRLEQSSLRVLLEADVECFREEVPVEQ